MILPLNEARLATLSTVAAAIAGTPWSIAWVTMWKIGPEWAAQHAKLVSAIAANCGVRRAWATVNSPPSAPVAAHAAPGPEAAGSRTTKAAGTLRSHARSPLTSLAAPQ